MKRNRNSLRFPKSILEFQRMFPGDAPCWNYLAAVRWGWPKHMPLCPDCGAPAPYFIQTRRLWQCEDGHQFSILTGTVMERSRLPLLKWFWAAYLVSTQTPGVSGVGLERQIDVSYETAYMMLQRLRAGMVAPDRAQLHGRVEVDETYVTSGRVRTTRRGRGAGKTLVVAAVEVRRNRLGRVRLRRINRASRKELGAFIRKHIKKGSTVVTDGWAGYDPVQKWGYKHVLAPTWREDELKHLHRVFSNLKAWLVGTHHGVSAKHLQAYLNEFAFRYEYRRSPQTGFLAVLQIGSRVKGPKYEGIYSAGERGGWKHPNPLRRKRKI